MLEWLIIGGGVHGTLLSHALIHRGGRSPHAVRVLDPHARPLSVWTRVTQNLRMRFLRSPCSEHIDLDPASIVRYVRAAGAREFPMFLARRPCPSLALFLEHSAHVIARYRLDELRWQGRASSIAPHGSGVRIETDAGTLLARNVIVAAGMSDNLSLPPWTSRAREAGFPVFHALEPAFDVNRIARFRRIVVVGGGMTAAHAAIALAEFERPITLVARHDIREQEYDADPRRMSPGTRPSIRARPKTGVRFDGTMTPELAEALRNLIRCGRMNWMKARVARVVPAGATECRLEFDDRAPLPADAIVLATGFDQRVTVPEWLHRSALQSGLTFDRQNYPALDGALCWHPRIRLVGKPAEPWLGPLAQNISGARRAVDRILATIEL